MSERNTIGKTPQVLTEGIIRICDSIGIYDLFYVTQYPKNDCRAGDCFHNVQMYIEKYGGTLLMGWAITVRENLYVECEAHAVWKTIDNDIVDVTPNNEDSNLTLFSHQNDMQPIKTPSKYIPFTESKLVQEYIDLRNQFEKLRCSTGAIPKTLMYRIIEIDDIFLKKVKPNNMCPCESGLKYRRCCGKEHD